MALCAGAGGLELGVGLAEADLRVLCYVERDAPAASVLVGQMEAGRLAPAAVWDDLKTFDARPWRGAVDCVLAGYPCQPFSVAGKRRGAADPRHLWPHVARAIRDARPAHVFLENVSAHLRMGGFDVLRELREMGYDVAAGLFTAEEVGGTHRRERLFIRGELADGASVLRPSVLRREPDGVREGGGSPLDDAEVPGRWAGQHGGGGRGEGAPGRREQDSGRLGEPNAALEHAEGVRGQGGEAEGAGPGRATGADAPLAVTAREYDDGAGDAGARGRAESPDGGLPLFPPAPGDRNAWDAILAVRPDLAPAVVQSQVRGMADGVASRVDRLRMLGNGVVPLVAAYAWRTLGAALRERARLG